MSLLASLVFALAAVAAIAALGLTIAQHRNAAMANIAALRKVDAMREFRFLSANLVARPAACVEVRRIAGRTPAPRRIKPSAGLRAAA